MRVGVANRQHAMLNADWSVDPSGKLATLPIPFTPEIYIIEYAHALEHAHGI